MRIQTARKRTPRRQEQLHLVQQAAAAEAEATAPEPEQPQDPNLATVNSILQRLARYGAQPGLPGSQQIVVQTQLHTLIRHLAAAGVIDGDAFEAEVWAQMANNLRGYLQQVEEQRLAMAQQQQQQQQQGRQPVKAPLEVWAPGRQ